VTYERDGRRVEQPAGHVISTMPLRELVGALEPAVPAEVRDAASRLKYRDFMQVALIVDQADVFPDNWIYIHDKSVKVGRIQNFKNWSPDMVPDQSKTCLGLEYFCNAGDSLWTMADADLVALARQELGVIGLVDPSKVLDGTVVRMPKAYPVYDEGFTDALAVPRKYLDTIDNLQPIGRNGTHKYNNQDHSMVMAILAARNVLGEQHDLWAVNADDEYHEEVSRSSETAASPSAADLRKLAATQPLVPAPVPSHRVARSGSA
jgi:protoporphyrinogen oxidase